MNVNKVLKSISVSLIVISTMFATSCKNDSANRQNNYISYTYVQDLETGMSWPDGQALPTFATPSDPLDMIKISALTNSEKVMFTYLQGLVNKTKPRIFLQPMGAKEGDTTWPDNLGLNLNEYKKADRFELLKKYMDEVDGIVLYNSKTNIHYVNLACTVGGIKNALPVDVVLYDKLLENGINMTIVEDLTTLTYDNAVDIYNYMYDTYWDQCTKRLIVSLDPNARFYVRDMAAATGAACIWTDNQKEEEKAVYSKFLADMPAGNAIAIGWYTEERSGIGAATEYGLSTIPADFYENSTVYAGTSHKINIPEVPDKPELENKIYLCIYLSDGDNVQYNQHDMYNLWENEDRGSVPINWTISPSLVDFGPGLLNYYYNTATENDCFSSGPSGLGYALLVDRHNDIVNSTDAEKMASYAKFTQVYLERAGLRSITIWDEATEMHMDAYTKYCRYLYGCSVEDWNRLPEPIPDVIWDNKLAFVPNRECYAGDIEAIYRRWVNEIRGWDGSKPLFLSAQGVSWEMTPANIAALAERLNQLKEGSVEILRADHFYALYNEANGIPFNLCMSSGLNVTSSDASANTEAALNGTPSGEIWTASNEGEKWIQIDFGKTYEISRYVLRHAGTNGLDVSLNTKDYKVLVSENGEKWTEADKYTGNTENVTDIDIDPVKARYLKIEITNPGDDEIARLADIEVYGKVV